MGRRQRIVERRRRLLAPRDQPGEALGGEMMLAVGDCRIVGADRHRDDPRRPRRFDHDQGFGKEKEQVGEVARCAGGKGLDHVDMVEADQAERRQREWLVSFDRRHAERDGAERSERGRSGRTDRFVYRFRKPQ